MGPRIRKRLPALLVVALDLRQLACRRVIARDELRHHGKWQQRVDRVFRPHAVEARVTLPEGVVLAAGLVAHAAGPARCTLAEVGVEVLQLHGCGVSWVVAWLASHRSISLQ